MPSLTPFTQIMIERTLTLSQIGLSLNEVLTELTQDEATRQEVTRLWQELLPLVRPRFAFVTTGMTSWKQFNAGHIINSHLKGSEALCFFVATAGTEMEQFLTQLNNECDMVRLYLANELGTIIVEKTADCMEELLQQQLTPKGLKRTNRFSPGYCGWKVAEQPLLFSLFGNKSDNAELPTPCGINLTDSCLMLPIKSVSGVIGIGHKVSYHPYTCGLCDMEQCYKRKNK